MAFEEACSDAAGEHQLLAVWKESEDEAKIGVGAANSLPPPLQYLVVQDQ